MFQKEHCRMPRIYRIVISQIMLISGVFILLACGQMTPASPIETQRSTTQPTKGNTNQMTPSLPTPADAGLQNLIDKAIVDLASRLSIPATDVELLEATSVVWPDGSLGCPREGMVYAQVLTPGYLIRLQSGDQIFEYHASRGTTVIFCETPSPPVSGTPADT
jgi:hypothetical protein